MQKIRLTETQLKKLISESVRKVIKEFDEPFPYDYKDAREREDYFQRATQHDFPDTRFKMGRTWEDTYYSLRDKKAADDKERQKADKLKARDEKKKAAAQKKSDIERIRMQRNRVWAKAVQEALVGSDDANEDYDGLMDFPLILKDGSQVIFHADSFMEPYEYADSKKQEESGHVNSIPTQDNGDGYSEPMSREYDTFSFHLGGTIDGMDKTEETPEVYFNVSTYVSPMDLRISVMVNNVDNVNRMATKNAITMMAKKEAIKRYKQLMKGNNIK